MNYRLKAAVQNTISVLPGPLAQRLYYLVQRTVGNLRRPTPVYHFERASAMAQFARNAGHPLRGRCFEVGTGRTLNIPIGFWLAGADEIVTTDLHRYLRPELVASDLAYLRTNEASLRALFAGFPNATERWARLRQCATLDDVLAKLPIRYLAPYRAKEQNWSRGSFDFHFSCNVLEHVPSEDLRLIFQEARELVGSTGRLLHFVDLSDHFAHDDATLSPLHFLRLSDAEWRRLAGNPFMYQSRNRVSDYRGLLEAEGFRVAAEQIERHEPTQQAALAGTLRVAPRFQGCAPDDLAALRYDFVAMFAP